MKRIALILLYLLLIFTAPIFIVAPLLFISGLMVPYIFYEIAFFGVLLDIISVQSLPIFTFGGIIVLVAILFIRKRLSFHV